MECIRSEKCHFCHSQRFMISKETEHVLMPRFSYLMLLARQITKPTILGQKLSVDREPYISHTYSMYTVSESIVGEGPMCTFTCVCVCVRLYHPQ